VGEAEGNAANNQAFCEVGSQQLGVSRRRRHRLAIELDHRHEAGEHVQALLNRVDRGEEVTPFLLEVTVIGER
jgi:hypothetical protein